MTLGVPHATFVPNVPGTRQSSGLARTLQPCTTSNHAEAPQSSSFGARTLSLEGTIVKKILAIIGLMGLTSATPQFAHSAVNFSIFISNAPPPPRVVFVHQPRFVLVPEEDVYYCEDDYSDYDVFRYGSFFYLYDDGYWYRANTYRGPFVAIRIDYVPRQIFYVSDYGYRWRQAPQWGSRSYSRWDSGDRRFRDWRSSNRRYSDRRATDRRYASRDGNTSSRLSDPWRSRSDQRRSGVRESDRSDRRSADRSWNDQRESRSSETNREWRGGRGSRNQDRDNDGDRGRGKGKGNGKGNSKGHGRGHEKA
jgi:hypothetical protein